MQRARILAAPSVVAKNGDAEGLPTVLYAAASRVVDVASEPLYGIYAAAAPGLFREGARSIGHANAQTRRLLLQTVPYGVAVALALYSGAGLLPRLFGASFQGSVAALGALSLAASSRVALCVGDDDYRLRIAVESHRDAIGGCGTDPGVEFSPHTALVMAGRGSRELAHRWFTGAFQQTGAVAYPVPRGAHSLRVLLAAGPTAFGEVVFRMQFRA